MNTRYRYLPLIAAIGWLIISIILLTLPGSAFPQESWLDKIWADKWIHIGMFSIMVVLWCLTWRSLKIKDVIATARNEAGSVIASVAKQKRAFIIIALIFLCYGIAMEFVQRYWVANRSFDIEDIIADAVGCTVGLIFSTKRYIKK